jgi:hypothetical protein
LVLVLWVHMAHFQTVTCDLFFSPPHQIKTPNRALLAHLTPPPISNNVFSHNEG